MLYQFVALFLSLLVGFILRVIIFAVSKIPQKSSLIAVIIILDIISTFLAVVAIKLIALMLNDGVFVPFTIMFTLFGFSLFGIIFKRKEINVKQTKNKKAQKKSKSL